MSAPTKKSSIGGAIFLALFGGFFAFMGIMAIVMTAKGEGDQNQSPIVGFVVGGIFACVGLGIIGAGIWSLKKGKQEAALAAQHPDAPWLLKKDWAEGRIVDSNKGAFFFMLAIAIFWNAISWTATIGVFSEGSDADPAAKWIVPLFPLVGAGLAWGAFYLFLRWRKFGSSTFEMAEVPGVIGGSLGGVILTKVNVKPEKGFLLQLRNEKQVTTGSGKNRSTHTTVVWESEQWIQEEAMPDDPTQSALPVFFSIPYTAHQTERIDNRTEYKWELKVKAELPGVDYESRFTVPVFLTKDSDPNFDAKAVRASEPASPAPVVDWRKSGITVRDDISGATLIETRMGRNFLFLFVPSLIGIGMLVGSYFAWNSNMPKIFPVFLVLGGLLATIGCVGSLLTSLRLKVFPDRLESERRFFGVPKFASMQAINISSIETKSNMSSGDVHFYDIVVHQNGGDKVRFPMSIKGKARAEAMLKLIEAKLEAR
ncbi:hypothetical protein [Cerasicoccus maritimus]|uniref:hypothetical protein n=1 Tax=Cerasicoccus maritimus TaxID=490089 RepID=UPI002852CC39|nr:hypothetical protein [Cerasicoccus maritimus]